MSDELERGRLNMPEYYEFFAGAGMARAGLGPGWTSTFANDFDQKKSVIYRQNWPVNALKTADVKTLSTDDLPGRASLAWASFPCQDLSLAGGGAGLKGDRSGTFWPFWTLMSKLVEQGRSPQIIALENVCGTLTSHSGKDFTAICSAFEQIGYRCGAVVIDAISFVPQSRPRLFVIGVRKELSIPKRLLQSEPSDLFHSRALRTAWSHLPASGRENWLWWSLPAPASRRVSLADIIQENPTDVQWHTPAETRCLLDMMSDVNRSKLDGVKESKLRTIGTVYKRTRITSDGEKVQRAEIRFDNVAGCLRTPAGGSSRQLIVVVEGNKVRSRLISGRETARLMGLPDSYNLPTNYNETYHLTGDGVVVPVVRFLAENVFEAVIAENEGLRLVA